MVVGCVSDQPGGSEKESREEVVQENVKDRLLEARLRVRKPGCEAQASGL